MQVFIDVCVSITGCINMQILKNRKWKNPFDKMYIYIHILSVFYLKKNKVFIKIDLSTGVFGFLKIAY